MAKLIVIAKLEGVIFEYVGSYEDCQRVAKQWRGLGYGVAVLR
jgi:hypothetical protein